MIRVFLEIEGELYDVEISEETHTLLRDGTYLRNQPIRWALLNVMEEFGALSEGNILKYIERHWAL